MSAYIHRLRLLQSTIVGKLNIVLPFLAFIDFAHMFQGLFCFTSFLFRELRSSSRVLKCMNKSSPHNST